MSRYDKITELASHFARNITAPEVGIFTMENFVFKNSPPTPNERVCYDRLVQKYRAGEIVTYEEWNEMFRPLWLKEEDRYSRYEFLLNQVHSMFKDHRETLNYMEWFDELEASTPEDDYDVDAWNDRSDEMFKIDGLRRSFMKGAGEALEGLLLNAARVSGCDEEELIKSLEEMAEKPIQEKIKSRMWRPNASPIRAKSDTLPDILMHTVDELEPYWDGVLIWLRQTHSARNRWKAFGHLVKRNSPARGARLIEEPTR